MERLTDDVDDLDLNDDSLTSENDDSEYMDSNPSKIKSKRELKKEHKKTVRTKLMRHLEKKRLRDECESIDGWL